MGMCLSISTGPATGTGTGGSGKSAPIIPKSDKVKGGGNARGTGTGGSGKSAPIIPKFVKVKGGGNARGDAIKFRLVSYNILAKVYATSDHFPHSTCLGWEARSQQILTLLKNLGADFYSLQEVDEYDSFYKKSMEGLGYSSIYIQRSGRKRDGCGIFYKKNRARLLLKEEIEYNDLVPSEHGDAKTDRVGIMAAFKLEDPNQHVVILANTHLDGDPRRADVKLAQAKYLLGRLAQFKKLVRDRFHCNTSVMLCGDFNSTPGGKVYKYLISGNTSSKSSERLPLPLCSVYASAGPKFKRTIDYVFFSPSRCLKVASILQVAELDSGDALPNYRHPSDHVPIGAEFEITKH